MLGRSRALRGDFREFKWVNKCFHKFDAHDAVKGCCRGLR